VPALHCLYSNANIDRYAWGFVYLLNQWMFLCDELTEFLNILIEHSQRMVLARITGTDYELT
jgi:hypothetical protein